MIPRFIIKVKPSIHLNRSITLSTLLFISSLFLLCCSPDVVFCFPPPFLDSKRWIASVKASTYTLMCKTDGSDS